MDDYDFSDVACPKCGHTPTHYRECQGLFCDDGFVDEWEEDPINYMQGQEFSVCPECHGTGSEHWCPACGYDLTTPGDTK
jgi:hypothetical protein